MRLTLDAVDVIVPRGEYGDEDDCLCRGCGTELPVWTSHTVFECLRILKDRTEKLEDQLQKKDHEQVQIGA